MDQKLMLKMDSAWQGCSGSLLDTGSDSAFFISIMASLSIVILELFRWCIEVNFLHLKKIFEVLSTLHCRV